MRSRVSTIGIAYNLKPSLSCGDDCEEYDEIATIEVLEGVIRGLGFKTVRLEQTDKFAANVLNAKPDFVLNIAEGIGDSRGRESQVPCVLESLGIPYSGSDPVSLGITLDKYLTGKFLAAQSLDVPRMFMVPCGYDCKSMAAIFSERPRWVVKPRWEGSSKGIFLSSLVTTFDELKQQTHRIHAVYHQPAIVEEYIDGQEITVGVYGNRMPEPLGMMSIAPHQSRGKFIYSLEVKRNWLTEVRYGPMSSIPSLLRERVAQAAVGAFLALELRDISRIDFRVDVNGIPRIIDVNPLPGLSERYSDLPILWRLAGHSYAELIGLILRTAFTRYGWAFD